MSNKLGQIEIHTKYLSVQGHRNVRIKTRWLYLLHPFGLINFQLENIPISKVRLFFEEDF